MPFLPPNQQRQSSEGTYPYVSSEIYLEKMFLLPQESRLPGGVMDMA